MELKNKEINKLFNAMARYVDLVSLPTVITKFMECDDAIEGEFAALKAELHDANGNVDHLRSVALERGDKLSKANNQIDELKEDLKEANDLSEYKKKLINDLSDKLNKERKHGEDLADANGKLASDNVDLKRKVKRLEHNLTEQLEGSVTYQLISDLQKENEKLKDTNIYLNEQHDNDVQYYEELDEKYQAAEHEIKVLKTLLGKELEQKVDLSYDHEFKFGDKVFVPWSCDLYVYIHPGRLYNPRTDKVVYVGKTQHLKWFGERFEIK